MPTLFLVRHGENPANLSKEFSHRRVDYPLNDKGRQQARQTAEFLRARQPIGAIFSSPLLRAAETAALIGAPFGLEPVIIEEFREINVGELEGQPPTRELWDQHDNVLRAWISGQRETRFPDGEDHHGLCERMLSGLRQVIQANPHSPSVIVGHGGIFTATLMTFCQDLDFPSVLRAPNHNCSISEVSLELDGDRPVGRLVRWAEYGHLSGEAAQLVNATFE